MQFGPNVKALAAALPPFDLGLRHVDDSLVTARIV
jgi:hypothetical protein